MVFCLLKIDLWNPDNQGTKRKPQTGFSIDQWWDLRGLMNHIFAICSLFIIFSAWIWTISKSINIIKMLHVNSWLIKFQGLSLIKSWLRSYRRRRPCFCRCALECSFVCFSKRRLSICSSENEFINTKSQKLGAANPPKERAKARSPSEGESVCT